MAAVFGIYAPQWLVYGYFPISLVLGLHTRRLRISSSAAS